MSDFNKRLYLTIGWIGDPDYTPFIFTIAIDAELKSRIAKLANILSDSSAVAIETPVKTRCGAVLTILRCLKTMTKRAGS